VQSRKKRVRTPLQSRSIEKKERIIRSAYELFSKKGYSITSIRMIAKKADVSIGAIYSYFRDKRDIFIEVSKLYTSEMYNSFLETIERDLKKTNTVEEAVYMIIRKLREIVVEHFTIHMETIMLSWIDERIRNHHVNNENRNARAIVTMFFKRFGDRLKIRDQTAAIFVVHHAVEEIIQYMLFYNVDISEELVDRELARMVAGYLEGR
jgi:AcrR family transcriptional regulator